MCAMRLSQLAGSQDSPGVIRMRLRRSPFNAAHRDLRVGFALCNLETYSIQAGLPAGRRCGSFGRGDPMRVCYAKFQAQDAVPDSKAASKSATPGSRKYRYSTCLSSLAALYTSAPAATRKGAPWTSTRAEMGLWWMSQRACQRVSQRILLPPSLPGGGRCACRVQSQ